MRKYPLVALPGRQFHVERNLALIAQHSSFTVRSFSSRFADSFSRSSPTVRMRSPFSEVISRPLSRRLFPPANRSSHRERVSFAIGAPKMFQLTADISASIPSRGCPPPRAYFRSTPSMESRESPHAKRERPGVVGVIIFMACRRSSISERRANRL